MRRSRSDDADEPRPISPRLRATKLRLEIMWLAVRIVAGILGLLGIYGALQLGEIV